MCTITGRQSLDRGRAAKAGAAALPAMPREGGGIAKFVIPFGKTGDKLTPISFRHYLPPDSQLIILNRPRVAPDPFMKQH